MAQKKQTITKGKLSEDFEYEAFRKKVISGLIAEKALTGESSFLRPLVADFVCSRST